MTFLKKMNRSQSEINLRNAVAEKLEQTACSEEEVMTFMDKYRWDESIQWKACKLLSELEPEVLPEVCPHHVDKRNDLIAMGANERILNAMDYYQDSINVQRYACWTLFKLARDDKNKINLMKLGAGDKILRAMDKHVTSELVQEQACGALWNLAVDSDVQVSLMKIGAMEKILKAMDNFVMSDKVQHEACGALLNFACGFECRVALVKLGGREKILRAMDTHMQSPKVLKIACGALSNFASYNDVQGSLVKNHAVDRLVRVMDAYIESEYLQENALSALTSFAALKKNNRILMELDAVEKIKRAMDNHRKSENVQAAACGALWNLTTHFDNRIKLMKMGAAEKILQAMDNHIMSKRVQALACGVMQNFTCANENQTTLMGTGLADKVFRAMDNHITDDSVQDSACGVFANLCVKEDNRKTLMTMGVGEKIIRAMENHIKSKYVQETACMAFLNLAVDNNNRPKLVEMGAVDKILSAMDNHIMSGGVQQRACAAFSIFCGNSNSEYSIMFLEMGLADRVQRAIDNHPSNKGLQKKARALLERLTRLSFRNIDDNDAKSLANVLKMNSASLAMLCLDNNGIGDEGTMSIADSLKLSTNLTHLDLSWNLIGDEGIKSLSQTLEVNTSLSWLSLMHNRIGEEGGKSLAESLQVNTTITFLNLKNNVIAEEACKALADALRVNSSITALNLESNPDINDESAMYLVDALNVNTNLTSFRIDVLIRIGEIIAMQKQKFLEVLKSDKKARLNRSRLMFVGQGKAGKSASVRSLLGKGFNPDWDSTIGTDISERLINSANSKWRNLDDLKGDFTSRFAARLMIDGSNTYNRSVTDANYDASKVPKRTYVSPQKKAQKYGIDGSTNETNLLEPVPQILPKVNIRDSQHVVPSFGRPEFEYAKPSVRIKEKEEINPEIVREYEDELVLDAKRDINSLTLSIWDFGGQQVFYAMHHIFLTQSGVYILVCDMRELLDPIYRGKALKYLSFWLRSIKLHAPTAPLLLTGTFLADIADKRDNVTFIDNLLRELVKESFSQVVRNTDEDLIFFPIDNKEGFGIDNLRYKLEEKAQEDDSVSKQVSIRWMALLDKIYSKRDTHSYLTLSIDVRNFGKEVGVKSSAEQETALALFHERGLLVHLTSTAVLKNIVVIKPQWLINALSKVIRDGNLHIDKGEFERVGLDEDLKTTFEKGLASRDFLEYVWNGEQVDFFLDLMERTMLLSKWKFDKNRVYLIPSLLKEGVIEKDNIKGSRCKIDFSSNYLPNGVFQRLLCLCVSHSVNGNENGAGYNEIIMEPRLQKHYATIEFEPGFIIHLLEDEEERAITFFVENDEFACKCLRIIQAMLRKVNHDVMSSGLTWDIYLENEVTKELICLSEAQKGMLSPWFRSELNRKKKAKPPAENIDLTSFLESL